MTVAKNLSRFVSIAAAAITLWLLLPPGLGLDADPGHLIGLGLGISIVAGLSWITINCTRRVDRRLDHVVRLLLENRGRIEGLETPRSDKTAVARPFTSSQTPEMTT